MDSKNRYRQQGLYSLIKQCVSLAALQEEPEGGTGNRCGESLDVPPLLLNSLESLPFPL